LAPSTTHWGQVKPSLHLFGFDGYQWLRDGIPIRGARSQSLPAAPGKRVACRVTVTFGEPFLVTATATS
jgi:hypothetical protein